MGSSFLRCADKTGNVVGMQKPCGEGLARTSMTEFRTQKAFSEAIRYVFGGAT
ncbi:MAG: hypothetical protein JRC56_00925 [Deltaproteobacteria bacterium]|nr:hypothetical protein [Deltaproteobacteria bacterium]MBW2619882.1 hypothetical protein [Deltaproteobacteria bacterium]